MRGLGLIVVAVVAAASTAAAQPVDPPQPSPFTFEKRLVKMRDGARMETVILRPAQAAGPLPILLQRTPYGLPDAAPPTIPKSWAALAEDGYIFVFQSMRGRFGSDGTFTLSTALASGKRVDEATDAYDSVGWLVKNVKGNNGRVGMWGVSYPGFAAAIALAKPHPALKAVSPQAAWIDYWQNDDLHRNGALRLTYATDWLYGLQKTKTDNASFEYGQADTYDWFLRAGSAENIERAYMKGAVPMLRALIEHPDHDAFYTRQRWSDALGRTRVPTLNVAGYWDQEDPWGSWQIYFKQQADDPDNLAQMVSGPWNHGGWHGAGDTLGRIPIGSESGRSFQREIEAPFFRHWLHAKGLRPAFEIKSLQSGSWAWKSYAQWPPAGAAARNLYLHADGSASFDPPASGEACREYVSDPASPVPFRARPISPTYPAPEWRWWEADDQRFVDGRPDVLTWTSAPLTQDLVVTGTYAAELRAATSGTDADFVVKLIDVLPEDVDKPVTDGKLGDYGKTMNGYQWPIAMEVRRGRYLLSDVDPKPLIPNEISAWDVPLREHDHVFRTGHRLMVQVQSSWFPVIDRNPQKFVPNIARARPEDYVKATQSVCPGSLVRLPVMASG
ncbi:MAG TPA: CocE/NonD family hydrolase [Novosphingobium sp.]|nr:CocE/NonD family hydrolase [Novosphingobium sp.]